MSSALRRALTTTAAVLAVVALPACADDVGEPVPTPAGQLDDGPSEGDLEGGTPGSLLDEPEVEADPNPGIPTPGTG